MQTSLKQKPGDARQVQMDTELTAAAESEEDSFDLSTVEHSSEHELSSYSSEVSSEEEQVSASSDKQKVAGAAANCTCWTAHGWCFCSASESLTVRQQNLPACLH